MVCGGHEGELQTDPLQATESGLPHSANGLPPAEDGLDPFPHMNTHGVASIADHAPVDGRALPLHGPVVLQPLPVVGEDRGYLGGGIHPQTHEPAEQ